VRQKNQFVADAYWTTDECTLYVTAGTHASTHSCTNLTVTNVPRK
jgi:hypothetical protein